MVTQKKFANSTNIVKNFEEEVSLIKGLDFIDFIDLPLEFEGVFKWIFEQCRRSRADGKKL